MKRWMPFVLCATLLVVVAGGASAQQPLRWTSGVVGGGWYAISTGLAALLREKAALDVKVLPGGGAQNPVLVGKGYVEIGLGLPPLLGAAARGDDPYRGRRLETLRGLAGNLSLNVFHIYVASDSPFAKMTLEEIFRGRKPIRLAIPRPGTSDVWLLEKMMEFFGLCEPGKIVECYRSWETAGAKFVRGSYVELADAFKERRVDGAFAILAAPADVVTSASQHRSLTLLSCPQPLLEHLASFGLSAGVIPAGTYPKAANASEDVPTATMGTTIIVSAAMADDLAYAITSTINDNIDRLRRLHASLDDYDPSRGWLHLGVALHPGAERYYREKGWLK
ncbi:MAG TPA: TAXI family TRAP transporter solute-binding subunit [Methylomirabilota bacterium]|nr:TAXI family TRAP transporter solute-binding subunit [Methylomirabilota bacterium]